MSRVIEFKKEVFKRTRGLAPAANKYLKNGYYTDALPGTKPYFEYWDEERRRCLYGYTHNGVTITGNHYFYLNYCPIDRSVDEELPDGTIIARRERTFPAFYDGDWKYFLSVDRCRRENKHMTVLKARRKGFSYKAAAMLVRNYFHMRNSKNYVFAGQKEYLIGDGLLSKAWDIMSFVDDNTAWTQPRLRDREMHKQSGYKKNVNGALVEMGMKSQIIGVSLKDDPDKVRGKAGELIFFEEAGSFPGLLKAWEVAMPTMRQGSKTLGTMIAFGTGGTEGSDFQGMEELFYNPDSYDCLAFKNVWDDGAMGTECGYFVPIFENLEGFIDDDGNSFVDKAIDFEEGNRNKKKGTNDPKAYDQYIAEHPMCPAEATLQVSSNLFDISSLQEQYNKVKANKLHAIGTAGKLYYGKENRIKFEPDGDARPILRFPHRKEDNLEGAIVLYEGPYRNQEGQTPHNLYLVCHDPYGQNQSADSSSLGAAYVIKRINNISKPDDLIVASYVGRPHTQDEYNKNLFMLADYYNAKIGFENDRGAVIQYAKQHRKLHRLQEEFEMLDKKELRSRNVKRNFGMHTTEARKRQGELYIRDWLNAVRSDDGDKVTLNLHKIYDLGLLQELIKFNHKGNFDRVMALMVGMYHTRELYNAEVKEILEDNASNDWFDKNYR
jgi:hypothetical protein|tara:strand:- start:2638 stop:4629 length:1992 start_codon:yes stop_codon:yes gene_type:complete